MLLWDILGELSSSKFSVSGLEEPWIQQHFYIQKNILKNFQLAFKVKKDGYEVEDNSL